MPEPRVLYVAGPGRSGSTLLSDVLGQFDGWTNVGELMFLWRNRAEGSLRSCGCGLLLTACPFWAEVASEAPDAFDLAPEVVDLVYRSRAASNWLHLVASERRGDGAFIAWRDAIAQLYQAIAKVAGSRVIVDSSKQPGPGFVATAAGVAEVSVLHMTRDPRAVVASWRAPKASREYPEEQLFAMRPSRSTFDWVAQSSATSVVLSRRVPAGGYRRLRYEDFAANPESSVAAIAAWMGDESTTLPFTSPSTAILSPSHSIAGNPDRLGATTRAIALDERWRDVLTPRTQRLVTLATWPVARAYGYR